MIEGDLFYSHSLAWPIKELDDIRVQRILFIGDPGTELLTKANNLGVDCRQTEPERTSNLLKGITLYRKAGTWTLVISTLGDKKRSSINGDRQQYLDDEDPIIFLLERVENFWIEAKSVGNSAKFNIGDSVQIIAEKCVGKIEKIRIDIEKICHLLKIKNEFTVQERVGDYFLIFKTSHQERVI